MKQSNEMRIEIKVSLDAMEFVRKSNQTLA